MTIVHKTKKTKKLYYTADNPEFQGLSTWPTSKLQVSLDARLLESTADHYTYLFFGRTWTRQKLNFLLTLLGTHASTRLQRRRKSDRRAKYSHKNGLRESLVRRATRQNESSEELRGRGVGCCSGCGKGLRKAERGIRETKAITFRILSQPHKDPRWQLFTYLNLHIDKTSAVKKIQTNKACVRRTERCWNLKYVTP